MGKLGFTEQVQQLDQRMRALLESFAHPPPGDGTGMLGELVSELSTSLEELKVAEEELARQNLELEAAHVRIEMERRRYRDMFLSAPEGYVLTDQRGTIFEANLAAAQLLGAPVQHLGGVPLPLFVVLNDRARFHLWLRQIDARDLAVATHGEFRLQTITRVREFSCALSFWRTSAEAGQPALRWAMRDLSERDRAREADRFEEEAVRKDEFLAVLAHELRNPLAAISLAADIIGQEVKSEAGQRASWAARTVRRHAAQLASLIDDLLDVSRVYHGKIQLSLAGVELGEVVAEAIETAQPALRRKRHVLAFDRGADRLWVSGDRLRLQQVLSNLLDNAAKYTPERGRIEVRLRRFGDRAIVGVRDFGAGIEPGAIDRIFGLFEQGANTGQGGLGIGLTLARELVRLHGGSIEARSDGAGQGSEFVVSLPLLAGEPAREELPVDEPAAAAGAKLLIVDDNRDAADLIAMRLEELGYRVSIAYSAAEALEAASGSQLALVDLAMPDMDGFELAPRLRRLVPDLQLFALTGFSDDRNRAAAARAGFQHYVLKPVDVRQLDAMLRAALTARGEPAPPAG